MWLLYRTGQEYAVQADPVRRGGRPRLEHLATGAVLQRLLVMPELELKLGEIGEQRAERGRLRAERHLLDPQGLPVQRQRNVRRPAGGRSFCDELQQDRDVRMVRSERLDPLLELPALELLQMTLASVHEQHVRSRRHRVGRDRSWPHRTAGPNARRGRHPGPRGPRQRRRDPSERPNDLGCRAIRAANEPVRRGVDGARGQGHCTPGGAEHPRDRDARASPFDVEMHAQIW